MAKKDLFKRALLIARLKQRHEVERMVSDALYKTADDKIMAMAKILSERCRGLGIASALYLLAAIGWELVDLEVHNENAD